MSDPILVVETVIAQLVLVVSEGPQVTLDVQETSALLVAPSEPGPPGPQGPSATQLIGVAGQILSGHMAVIAPLGSVTYASADNALHAGKVIGVTLGAAQIGASVTIQTSGPVIENTWTWTPGPIFVGLNGQLVQAPPAAAFVQCVATAISATEILVGLEPPILT